jgi:probable F420-dependent oxidoreductase
VGVWVSRGALAPGEAGELAALAEELGYGAFWISGSASPGVFDAVLEAVRSTSRITVATGVVNMWIERPRDVTAGWHAVEAAAPGRLMVGLGISHAPLVRARALGEYSRPLARTHAYLDDLDAATDPLPPQRRLLGALGPKMLELSAVRAAGAHPYVVTPAHTEMAREILGGAVLAPEQTVVLDPDATRARTAARQFLATYLRLPNYTRNWLRVAGLADADLAEGGSDRLVDAIVAHGPVGVVAAAVEAHWTAGADHVCVQVLGGPQRMRQGWADLATVLPGMPKRTDCAFESLSAERSIAESSNLL